MLKPDKWIKKMALEHKMIEPFEDAQVKKGISYGVSSYGYDFRLNNEFKIYRPDENAVLDPKNFPQDSFESVTEDCCIIPANSFVLARSLEYFRIPRNILTICVGKSSYARCGVIVNVTPFEPCYDKETEILTLDGWKKFYELKEKEATATLNKQGELEYQNILEIQKFRYQGKLIRIQGRNIDLAVTLAHRLLVRKRWRKEFEFISAAEIYKKYNYELKRNAIWHGKKKDYFELPALKLDERFSPSYTLRKEILNVLGKNILTTKEAYQNCGEGIKPRKFLWTLAKLENQSYLQKEYSRKIINKHSIRVSLWRKILPERELSFSPAPTKIPMDDWLRFFGIWLAEGSCYAQVAQGNYIVKIACFDKKIKETIKGWFERLPFHFFETESGFTILSKQLYSYLLQFGHSYEKFIPLEIKSLPTAQLKILLEAIFLGDGDIQTMTYTTSSKKLADDLQEIILKCGWAAIVRQIPKEKYPVRRLKGYLIKSNHDIYKVRISKKQLTPKIYKHSFSKIDYDDLVYDVTVPNHTLYVRRRGKTCWSSNCWEGYATLGISNTSPSPAKVYAGEGIAQIIFLESDEECLVSYKDKKGKYQAQREITLPKV